MHTIILTPSDKRIGSSRTINGRETVPGWGTIILTGVLILVCGIKGVFNGTFSESFVGVSIGEGEYWWLL